MLQVSGTTPAPKRFLPKCSGKSQVALALAAANAGAAPASAADANPDATTGHGSFSILFENDLFFNTDRDYTSGQALDYITAPDETPTAIVDLAHSLRELFGSGEVGAGYELGRAIVAPETLDVPNPPLDERPYAGFLWLVLSALTRTDQRLNQLEMQLGVIGPASLAGNAQIFVHAVRGFSKPLGWHYQLRDEPALQFTFDRTYKVIPSGSLLGLLFDAQPHLGAPRAMFMITSTPARWRGSASTSRTISAHFG